jgi:RNA polymerase sigma factor for flagellar operon FliA
VVAKLRKAGAIILGKAILGEFGAGDAYGSLFGVTRNPYDLERTSGGSSGGSGACTSANLTAVAVGEEGFVQPSACAPLALRGEWGEPPPLASASGAGPLHVSRPEHARQKESINQMPQVRTRAQESDTAPDEMIVSALPLVAIIAKHIAQRLSPCVTIDELISAGTIGLIKAARRFDSERGLQFRTYARHRIRGEILDCLRSQDPLSRSERRARRERATDSDLSAGATWVSLESILDEISKAHCTNERNMVFMSRAHIRTARQRLSSNENRIIELSFYAGWTNREIGQEIGLSEGRVWQIRTRALSRLRASFL